MNFLIAEPDSVRRALREEYGAGICAIGIRAADAQRAFDRAIELGAWAFEGERIGAASCLFRHQGIGDYTALCRPLARTRRQRGGA